MMTAWIVILRRFAVTYVRAKHIRAELLNSNIYTCIISELLPSEHRDLSITLSL